MEGGYELTLHGLLRKRGELTSEVEALRANLEQRMGALDAIDQAIRVFKPDIGLEDLPERPAPPPNAAFRGEVQRFLLDTLRHAPEPLTTHDMARKVMEARQLNTADRILFALIAKRTGHSLTRLRRMGYVESHRFSKGAMLEWRLSRKGEAGGPVGGWRNGSSG